MTKSNDQDNGYCDEENLPRDDSQVLHKRWQRIPNIPNEVRNEVGDNLQHYDLLSLDLAKATGVSCNADALLTTPSTE